MRRSIWAAVLGVVVVLIFLTWPIKISAGDHERHSCGNAFAMDVSPWRSFGEENEFDHAYQQCVSARVGRVAYAVAALSLTALVLVGFAAQSRRADAVPDAGR